MVYSTTNAQIALDTNGVADVYLYDFVTQSNFLVSQSNPPGAANGPSDSPVISNDGRFVAYRSTATNLALGATNGLPNVFLYDRQTGTTTLLSANATGMAGNNRSFTPQFSGDGQTVVFQSWASDLIAQDFNQVNDLFGVRIAPFIPTPPTITSQPVNQTVLAGNSVTFSVGATGTAPLSCQWKFNGTNIGGATYTTLTLTNVQWSQAGNYTVLVTNAYGSILSSNAVLMILAPPVIDSQPTNQTVTVGGTALFSVTASGTPPLSYQWSFNGTDLPEATNAMLTLTNAQVSQAGNYSVLVTNLFGSILSSNAVLAFTPDYFAWEPIPSPRFVNTPFAVTIQARNTVNGLFTNFTGTALLGSTNGIAVTPSVSVDFVQGVWTGSVVISQTNSNLVLQASDGFGHSGLANPINAINLPSLGMLHSGNIALFMWPVEDSGFVLEASGNLSPAMWVVVPYAPFQIGDQYLLPLNMTGSNGFYRLWFPGP